MSTAQSIRNEAGYYYLSPGEEIQAGDEVYLNKEWLKTQRDGGGKVLDSDHLYRRKITAPINTTQPIYKRGDAVLVDGCPGWTYVAPHDIKGIHVLKNHHGQSFQIFEARISPDVPPEQATKKSLGEIAFLAGNPGLNNGAILPFNQQNQSRRAAYESIGQAIKTAVLAEANPVYKTSERKPTREDAGTEGDVLSWARGRWINNLWDWVGKHPQDYTHWMPMPAAPPVAELTEEGKELAAFNEVVESNGWDWTHDGTQRLAWLAALEYAKEQQGK